MPATVFEQVLFGLIDGLGLIGDSIALAVVTLLEYFFGEGAVPPYVGKLTVLGGTAFTIYYFQRSIPKYLAIACIIAALVIVFGGTYW